MLYYALSQLEILCNVEVTVTRLEVAGFVR